VTSHFLEGRGFDAKAKAKAQAGATGEERNSIPPADIAPALRPSGEVA
jgi:hypothetical protein